MPTPVGSLSQPGEEVRPGDLWKYCSDEFIRGGGRRERRTGGCSIPSVYTYQDTALRLDFTAARRLRVAKRLTCTPRTTFYHTFAIPLAAPRL